LIEAAITAEARVRSKRALALNTGARRSGIRTRLRRDRTYGRPAMGAETRLVADFPAAIRAGYRHNIQPFIPEAIR
jgi:hypothetical protein